MAREHQKAKNNPYLLPHNLYMRVLYIIRDYDRMKDEYQVILEASPAPRIESGFDRNGKFSAEFMPKSCDTAKPTEDKALRLAVISGEMHAIEQALLEIPRMYRRGVVENITEGAWYPKDASPRTYRRWKQRYAYNVAKKLKLA